MKQMNSPKNTQPASELIKGKVMNKLLCLVSLYLIVGCGSAPAPIQPISGVTPMTQPWPIPTVTVTVSPQVVEPSPSPSPMAESINCLSQSTQASTYGYIRCTGAGNLMGIGPDVANVFFSDEVIIFSGTSDNQLISYTQYGTLSCTVLQTLSGNVTKCFGRMVDGSYVYTPTVMSQDSNGNWQI